MQFKNNPCFIYFATILKNIPSSIRISCRPPWKFYNRTQEWQLSSRIIFQEGVYSYFRTINVIKKLLMTSQPRNWHWLYINNHVFCSYLPYVFQILFTCFFFTRNVKFHISVFWNKYVIFIINLLVNIPDEKKSQHKYKHYVVILFECYLYIQIIHRHWSPLPTKSTIRNIFCNFQNKLPNYHPDMDPISYGNCWYHFLFLLPAIFNFYNNVFIFEQHLYSLHFRCIIVP